MSSACVVGIDFGTLSGRAVVVRAHDGAELGTAVHDYASAVMDDILLATGQPLGADWVLQDPEDYLDVLRHAVPAALRDAGVEAAEVHGIAIAFTASSPLPARADGTPLCVLPEWRERPHAWVKLWRHHAAQAQADRVTAVAAARGEPWLARHGGRISAEWQLAKALQLLEEDPETFAATDRWIEAADWLVWQLCGVETRNACTAGYKAQRQDGRYPSAAYLEALHPSFGALLDKYDAPVVPLGACVGGLTAQAAVWTGLPEGIAVAAANVDAHATAPAAQALAPGTLLAVMGTSTCHVMNGERLAEVPGMCGVVDGGILAGRPGYEAGQSGVGDIFAWFVRECVPAHHERLAAERGLDVHQHLSELGNGQPVGAHGLVALDWLSGNRSVLVDHRLSGAVVGLTLGTRTEDIYRALLESTAFGTRRIIEAFEGAGIEVAELVAAGGLVRNPVLMQMYADVTARPLGLIGSAQGPALGAAIHAAVAAGLHADVETASAAMGRVRRAAYIPDPARAAAYRTLYREYTELHDHFGPGAAMHRLRDLSGAS